MTATTGAHMDLPLKGFSFEALLHADGLHQLDKQFLSELHATHPGWHEKLIQYRAQANALTPEAISETLINCATFLETFLADLFRIEEPLAIANVKTTSNNPISLFKKYFVLRRAKKELAKVDSFPPLAELNAWLQQALASSPLKANDDEMAVALFATTLLNEPEKHANTIETLVQWCTRSLSTHESKPMQEHWVSFRLPERVDFMQLVPTHIDKHDKYHRLTAPDHTFRQRDGFKLTDQRMSAREVQDEVNYCVYCHDNQGDFCSKGFPVKKGDPAQGFKKNPLDTILTGCPLEEKISEMNFLKRDGNALASLAMVMVDNPMCPATGHRICNDCMKACIYQKQDPVNIPQIETRVLTDVLDLPYGVEIYDLLTRWNPLRQSQWVMKPYNGLKVLVAGMGPAGFTLAHHLLLEGFAVVGFDGLKIEPLPPHFINTPIKHFADLVESLDERLMAGFGGVAEYGITVRWDKNFLKLIYLSLMRRPYFQVFGGVRFGGTVTVDDAWDMGFDHFVVAVGAGLPKALPIPHSMAPGMKQANDFLMALQLGNAAKSSSLTNLQVRLPAVVIGGGLTGVDTATEIQAYYISLVEKTLSRYEILQCELGEDTIHRQLDPASREILAEYVRHGKAVRKERERATQLNESPDFIKLIREWGGVTIVYRRSMQESPAYINNHDELKKALEEGIYYLEGLEPARVNLNEFGHAESLICHKRIKTDDWVTTAEEVPLPARSILVATGTQPNTAYEFEHKGTFHRLNLQYQHYEDHGKDLTVAHGVLHCKDPQFGPFTSYQQHDRRISLVGDTHPVFHGSVVKAIASGLRTYPKILAVLSDKLGQTGDVTEYQAFAEQMHYLFNAKVTAISRKTDNTIEMTIQAPMAAKHFLPGQFFRLQNFETLAPRVDHTLLQMEPLSLVTAECDKTAGTLTFIVNETSASAKLCASLLVHEPVSLMGPTGVRAKIPAEHETVLVIGNEHSYAFLRSYGPDLRKAGNHVIYVCQLPVNQTAYCKTALESAADETYWLTPDDDIIEQLASLSPNIRNVDRLFIIGGTDLLRRFQAERKQLIKDLFVKDPKFTGAVYGNMQCMLKGVCAQCLQWQIDPDTGERTKAVFACSWQDQPLELIDINHMDERREQNRLLDTLSNLWVDHLFATYPVERV